MASEAAPECAADSGPVWLRTGNKIGIDLEAISCDMLVAVEEIARGKKEPAAGVAERDAVAGALLLTVGQLDSGVVLEMALKYRGVAHETPRHNH